MIVERPLRLNFGVSRERINRFCQSGYFISLAMSKKRKSKSEIEKEVKAGKELQHKIVTILEVLRVDYPDGKLEKSHAVFEGKLKESLKISGIKFDAALKKALLTPGLLGEKDPTADPCLDAKGNFISDPDLRDTENVPLPGALLSNGKRDMENELIPLPLPLAYESKKNKNKIDKSELLNLAKDHCEAYLAKEVLPYRDDAWIDHNKIKVGYEIPFNRHFYQYEPPRELQEIEGEIKNLEKDILSLLNGVV